MDAGNGLADVSPSPVMEKQSFFFLEHFVNNFCYSTLLHNYSCQAYPTATPQASFFFFFLNLFRVSACTHPCTVVIIREQTVGVFLTFHPVGPRDQAQILRLGGQ